MPKYINVAKQLVRLYRLNLYFEDVIKEFLVTAEPEEVVKVKHGKWVIKDESYWRPHYSGDIQVNKEGLYCSECDKRLANAQKYRNFCPNCGADMRKETGDG